MGDRRDGRTRTGSRTRVAVRVLVMATGVAISGVVPAVSAGDEPCPNATFRSGPSAHLPDCRAYEQVSPAEKDSENAYGEGQLSQATLAGESVAYTSKNVFADSLGAEVETAYVSARSATGWQTTAFTPAVRRNQPVVGDIVSYVFSGDLSQAVVKVPSEALTPEAPEGVFNLFLRRPDGSYSLVTAAPPSIAIPSGCNSCYTEDDIAAFKGASSDVSHIVFEANEGLLTSPRVPAGQVENLYESNLNEPAAQRVHPVGILPDGTLAAEGSQAGAGGGNSEGREPQDIAHAVSSDGSRIVFTAVADGGVPDAEQSGLRELYDRLGGPGGNTVEASAPAPGAQPSKCETPNSNCEAEPAHFWNASEDGSVVLFTSRAELTTQSNTGPTSAGDDLYLYSVDTGTLTDLTPDSTDANGANVQGVVGSSSDGRTVYFVATGILAPTNAEGKKPGAGEENLYVSNEHGTTFIATLGEPDSRDWTAEPEESQAYVTPDGGHLAFTSIERLTGYDNTDQHTATADTEVFEYSTEDGRLECASCNPDPLLRPVGKSFIGAPDFGLTGQGVSPFHQPRALSDDGSRLFFSSSDRLVPEAVSLHVMIYEYEAGAAHLISSGESEDNDIFMDASANGNDVFLATSQQLAPSDHDGAIDVYDARVGGGFAPVPQPARPCQGEACLPPQSTPPSLSLPGSLTLNGPGNLQPPPATASRPVRPKPLTRAQKLARALTACRREPKRKRGACVRSATRRYGHASKAARARKASRRSS